MFPTGVIREFWSNVEGDSIQNLLADSRFPHRPTRINLLDSFDAPNDNHENYAQRIKGIVKILILKYTLAKNK